ncbi:hypothetical protein QBC40DRAFT_350552 [Triangularia verruculosa]|uniref:Uncharacterized protein n=1 Tax=Triangularia verruculosa TaxID=2587418 RepID=A0AAN6XD74_9PEZI|nr:hypothetical protein QBC40DRAFT_350552 [Triangularia verruculosa]
MADGYNPYRNVRPGSMPTFEDASSSPPAPKSDDSSDDDVAVVGVEFIDALTKWNKHTHEQQMKMITVKEAHRQRARIHEKDTKNTEKQLKKMEQDHEKAMLDKHIGHKNAIFDKQYKALQLKADMEEANRDQTNSLLQSVPEALELAITMMHRHEADHLVTMHRQEETHLANTHRQQENHLPIMQGHEQNHLAATQRLEQAHYKAIVSINTQHEDHLLAAGCVTFGVVGLLFVLLWWLFRWLMG